jgi:hypothetical protein
MMVRSAGIHRRLGRIEAKLSPASYVPPVIIFETIGPGLEVLGTWNTSTGEVTGDMIGTEFDGMIGFGGGVKRNDRSASGS